MSDYSVEVAVEVAPQLKLPLVVKFGEDEKTGERDEGQLKEDDRRAAAANKTRAETA